MARCGMMWCVPWRSVEGFEFSSNICPNNIYNILQFYGRNLLEMVICYGNIKNIFLRFEIFKIVLRSWSAKDVKAEDAQALKEAHPGSKSDAEA